MKLIFVSVWNLLVPVLALSDAVTSAENYASIDTPNTFYSTLMACPAACQGTPQNWTIYSDLARLSFCTEPVLLDFAIYNRLDDENTNNKLRVCSARGIHSGGNNAINSNLTSSEVPKYSTPIRSTTRNNTSQTVCGMVAEKVENLEVALSTSGRLDRDENLLRLLSILQNYFQDFDSCESSVLFGYHLGTVVGIYIGASFETRRTSLSVINHILDLLKSQNSTPRIIAQLCDLERSSDRVFGIVTDTAGSIDSLASVQRTIVSWSDGLCVESPGAITVSLTVWEEHVDPISNLTTSNLPLLRPRSDCTTTKVVSQDSCGKLATRCGISPADFTKYNPDSKLCSTLQTGQRVCCSAGNLPDIRPTKNDDGSCSFYTIVANDNCSKLGAAYGLNQTMIEKFNNKTTWGWTGCSSIMVGTNICLSDGSPPMPAPMSNAVCGPMKPGTLPVLPGSGNLTMMNQCPLNACCDIWGQCGIDSEFCTDKKGQTGNPGTAPPGMNGCISNCGTDIVNNGVGPSTFQSIGYYESWNWDRPCLHLRAQSIDVSKYTHIHWAFASITSDWNVLINDSHHQWEDFLALKGIKRIVSFGGWGYSTEPATYDVLRQAMMANNRNTFASNVARFVDSNGLDGVDFDWEYPGAPDIPGVPPGLDTDAPNYLKFLTTLKGKLTSGKSLSIAAPASFWYLKAFPIAQMAKLLDYIVFMTYDLHGQWDYGSRWSAPGCPAGNCLRSHVNLTETLLVLAMITKAGVPSRQVNVGVSSYGRSFRMTDSGCATAMCSYEGPASQAAPGKCTGTRGYISNAEIQEIINNEDDVHTYQDKVSGADMLIYNDKEWVSYMSDATKAGRKAKYQNLKFGGIIDWAIDLQSFAFDDEASNDDDQEILDEMEDDLPPAPPLPLCDASYTTFEQLDADVDKMPHNCRGLYVLQVLDILLTSTLDRYTKIMANGYDHKFNVYADAVVQSAGNSVSNFYNKQGDRYFTCVMTEFQICCSQCHSLHPHVNDPNCRYCFEGSCYKSKRAEHHSGMLEISSGDNTVNISGPPGLGGDPPEKTLIARYKNVSEPCPPDMSLRGYGQSVHEQTTFWSLRADKTDQFWADLYADTSISQQNIRFGNINLYDCKGGGLNTQQSCLDAGHWMINVPMPYGYDRSDVSNPKDVVLRALANGQTLAPQLKSTINSLRAMSYHDSQADLIDALALPVSMIADAVDQMEKVAEVAEHIEEEKRKAMILLFLGAILFFIPIAGEVVGTMASVANIGRFVALMGVAGNAAMDIYTLVKDKDNTPLAIFGLVLTPLALADVAILARAADLRRGMKEEDVAKLGKKVEARMNTMKKIAGHCRKK